MIKFIFVFLLILINLYSKEINFSETKYISAVDMYIKKNGTINIEPNTIILNYPKKDKKYIFNENGIELISNNKKETLLYEKNLGLEIFHKLLKGIYENDLKIFEDYFNIEKVNNETILNPNDYISHVISNIKFQKDKDFLYFLEIYFTNDDRIKIVQTK